MWPHRFQPLLISQMPSPEMWPHSEKVWNPVGSEPGGVLPPRLWARKPLWRLCCMRFARKGSNSFFPALLKFFFINEEWHWNTLGLNGTRSFWVLPALFHSYRTSGLQALIRVREKVFLIIVVPVPWVGTILTIQGSYARLSSRPALSKLVATGHL